MFALLSHRPKSVGGSPPPPPNHPGTEQKKRRMGHKFLVQENPTPIAPLIYQSTLFWGVIVYHAVGLVWNFRRRHLPVIGMRSPYTMCGIICCLWITLAVDQFIGVLDPTWYCDYPWLQSINSAALNGVFCLAMWRMLNLIQKFESQRIRRLIQLYGHGGAAAAGAGGSGGGGRSGSSADNTSLVKPAVTATTTAATTTTAVAVTGTTNPTDSPGTRAELLAPNFFQRNLSLLQSRRMAGFLVAYSLAMPIARLISPAGTGVLICDVKDDLNIVILGLMGVALLALSLKVREVRDAFLITVRFASSCARATSSAPAPALIVLLLCCCVVVLSIEYNNNISLN